MQIVLVKTMQTRIIAQPQKRSNAQVKRVQEFLYSFDTNLQVEEVDWDTMERLTMLIIEQVFKIVPDERGNFPVKNLEISVNFDVGTYTIRFATSINLKNNTYITKWE